MQSCQHLSRGGFCGRQAVVGARYCDLHLRLCSDPLELHSVHVNLYDPDAEARRQESVDRLEGGQP